MKSRKFIKSRRANTTKKKSIKSRRKINKSKASRINKSKVNSKVSSKVKPVRKSKVKTSRKSRMKKTVKKSTIRDDFCKALLKEKIAYNMREYKSGRWKSRQQAIAVAYSQMRRDSKCLYLKR
jgi:hypothetical protein